jgi:two-component system, response regulator
MGDVFGLILRSEEGLRSTSLWNEYNERAVNEKYVLLVEDNPDEVVLTKRAFGICQISSRLMVVCDGMEALDFIFCKGKYSSRDLNEKPCLILLDINLTTVGGLQILNEIRATKSTDKIPVVVLTSSTEERDQKEGYRLGANDYFCKPTRFSEFVGLVNQIKSKWLDSNGSTAEF